MKCPIDGTELKMADRQGVEIDYCPKCRGVWLDRGELDKIIEKATPAVVLPDPDPVAPPPPMPDPIVAREPRPDRDTRRSDDRYRDRPDRGRYRDDDDDDDYRHGRRYKKRKRKSILSEIFDFD
ncbi:zf-TFIIB domain-containing protein [Aliiroseovarius sediminis]|uniref:TFIIB-type zinc ribbon-containing protein n=1 Tax=Aliiroseovarius sediminis TaxID=2925839 RepID=UPI001F5A6A30|nr:zf-TFIIB domain-containing protein [Aliiroseovarius sediminis]MCI2395098.1 zf-TFIIB domain-containing protein [Aliiroseovarius sediminis]